MNTRDTRDTRNERPQVKSMSDILAAVHSRPFITARPRTELKPLKAAKGSKGSKVDKTDKARKALAEFKEIKASHLTWRHLRAIRAIIARDVRETLGETAKNAGISRATLYRYFDNRLFIGMLIKKAKEVGIEDISRLIGFRSRVMVIKPGEKDPRIVEWEAKQLERALSETMAKPIDLSIDTADSLDVDLDALVTLDAKQADNNPIDPIDSSIEPIDRVIEAIEDIDAIEDTEAGMGPDVAAIPVAITSIPPDVELF